MKRTREAVWYEILHICRNPVKKTHIVYRANLNFKTAGSFLKDLMDEGAIARSQDGCYRLTETGKELYGQIRDLPQALRGPAL